MSVLYTENHQIQIFSQDYTLLGSNELFKIFEDYHDNILYKNIHLQGLEKFISKGTDPICFHEFEQEMLKRVDEQIGSFYLKNQNVDNNFSGDRNSNEVKLDNMTCKRVLKVLLSIVSKLIIQFCILIVLQYTKSIISLI